MTDTEKSDLRQQMAEVISELEAALWIANDNDFKQAEKVWKSALKTGRNLILKMGLAGKE
ncbi:hypothetical protein CVP05_03205 [Conservatibacter flavescens]|uniref:Uncharacterized protein n=2 Tax=Conservatibacter flavescens TaxID=28161 RepID=A0A2M8S4X3_9PAST|nr:hypothetical protein CVP05_03205 [Conservatibacter flavescens]